MAEHAEAKTVINATAVNTESVLDLILILPKDSKNSHL